MVWWGVALGDHYSLYLYTPRTVSVETESRERRACWVVWGGVWCSGAGMERWVITTRYTTRTVAVEMAEGLLPGCTSPKGRVVALDPHGLRA